MAENKESKKNIVRLTDVVAVRATAENPSVKRGRMDEGQIYEVHPNHLDYLLKKKFATKVEK
jgi:hypothetical protein